MTAVDPKQPLKAKAYFTVVSFQISHEMKIEDTIDEAISSLNLDGKVRRLSDEEARIVLEATAREFVEEPASLWWWESLKPDRPIASYYSEADGYRLIPRVCPDESSWFVVTDDRDSNWSVYESSPADIASILGECHYFEYFVASKRALWIVFENHHDMIIGIGDEVTGAIDGLSV